MHLHDHPGPVGSHPRLRRVERSAAATLHSDLCTCTVRAEPQALALRAEAGDAADLRRIETLVAADIERFGAREHLTVDWHDCDHLPNGHPRSDVRARWRGGGSRPGVLRSGPEPAEGGPR